MKNFFTLLALIFIISPVLSQNQERLSVHFFDVPENLESKFLKFNCLVILVLLKQYQEGAYL